MTGLPPSLGRFTQSEVEPLLHLVAETYGLSDPPAPSLSDPSAPAPGPQSTPQPQSIWDDSKLSPKIWQACRIAREKGYRYIWIDSCCIDKSSSSELSEAINSMYKWYGLAAVCYAYLADVPPGEYHHAWGSAFRKSRWFLRGWTLQELIAPLSVEFLSQDWAPIDSKHGLVDLVESVTKIDERALLHLGPLDTFSVAQRLSWAANRETTRVEDRAYSLLGIFDINMPTLYGEGDRAFRRLQEQIMQRTPDQSLFAWGELYLGSGLPDDLDFADTSKVVWAAVGEYEDDDGENHLLAVSPRPFKGCEHISASRHDTIQLPAHLSRQEIEYTSTPYGIRTQFWMMHLTQDLDSLRIPLDSEDVQLKFRDLMADSQWYLVILRCEHQKQPGHLLGRVCYTSPSESNVPFIHDGYIDVTSPQCDDMFEQAKLLPLSPKTIEHCRPQIELKTVYIPHPNRSTLSASSNLRYQPYTTIKLVLLRVTRNALHSRGYKANLRAPDPDHRTMHCLTLSKDEHSITVEFQHTLEDGGYMFTIEAEVKMSGSHVQLDSAPDSDRAERHTVSWSDVIFPWRAKLDHEKVRLSAAGGGTLTVDLGLDFGGHGYYFLHVDILSDAPPASSAVEPAVYQEEEGERTRKAHHLKQSTLTMWFKRIGREMAPSVEDRDVVAPSDTVEDVDGDGVLT